MKTHRENPLLLLTLILIPLGVSVAEEPLQPTVVTVDEAEHMAALTPQGWVGERLWHAMSGFNEGLCPVQEKKDGLWGAIDLTGNLVIPLEYDEVGQCRDGMVSVKKGKAWGYLKPDGTVALPLTEEWESAGKFTSQGLAPVKKGGSFGFINKQGQFVIPPAYEEAAPFSKDSGTAHVKKGGLWGWIDPSGKEVIPPTWFEAQGFADGRAAVRRERYGKWGFIDHKGNLVLPLSYDEVGTAGTFLEGYCWVKTYEGWIAIDTAGKVFAVHADQFGAPKRGIVRVWSERKLGLVRLDGGIAEPVKWPDIILKSGCYTVIKMSDKVFPIRFAVRKDTGEFSPWFPAPIVTPPPGAPILRIEAGMHTASIRSISSDAQGKFALTCSDDQTARLWSMEKGQEGTLIRTFRLPTLAATTQSLQGELEASLSPDGNIAMIRQYDTTHPHNTFVFNTATGKLLYRINQSLPQVFLPYGKSYVDGDGNVTSLETQEILVGGPGEHVARHVALCPPNRLIALCRDNDWQLMLYELPKAVLSSVASTPQMKLLRTHEFRGGKDPIGLSVSPDGTRVAVIHQDSEAVTLHRTEDLSIFRTLENTGAKDNDWADIAWLRDGRLALRGRSPRMIRLWPSTALSLTGASKGEPLDLPAAENTIHQIYSLPAGAGAVGLFAAATPQWGAISDNSVQIIGHSPTADFRDCRLRISADASEIAFDYDEGQLPATFSIKEGKLTNLDSSLELPGHLLPPKTTGSRINVTNWRRSSDVKLNGAELVAYASTCLAIAPDESFFILGAQEHLFCFGPNGEKRWLFPGRCWAVNLSRDGRIAVAAYGDGTIRWHDVEHEGRELLALFPHADRKRWVLWSPMVKHCWKGFHVPISNSALVEKGGAKVAFTHGYLKEAGITEGDVITAVNDEIINDLGDYNIVSNSLIHERELRFRYLHNGAVNVGKLSLPDAENEFWKKNSRDISWVTQGAYFMCSEGAEDLIGWHVDRGPDREPDFFPCSQLYDAFYRPDIVKTVLAERRSAADIAKDLGLTLNVDAALKKTPQIQLQGAQDGETVGTDTLQLSLEATDTGGGLRNISFFHNGKRVPADGPGRHGARGNLPTQMLRFTVMLVPGENKLRAQAANDKETIGTPAELTVKFNGVQATSTLHLLTLGLNRYQNPKYNLTYCVPDADACAEAFSKRAPGLFADVKTYALRDDQATKPKIAETFATIAKSAKPQDLFIFCYAGHGVMGEKPEGKPGDNEFYLVPHDITRMYGDPAMLAEKAVSKADLEDWCAKVSARKQLMLLDTCQSGGLVDTFAMRGVAEEKAIAMLARATGTVVIASTGAEAYARESKEIGHGIFTKALLDGLLEAKADADNDGKITVKEIDAYIGQAVPELSQKLTNTPQFPTSYARGQDFPIGIVK